MYNTNCRYTIRLC